jgi:hypothetical protein
VLKSQCISFAPLLQLTVVVGCGGVPLMQFAWPLLVGVGCVAGIFFKFLVESLILAQDERWRRA